MNEIIEKPVVFKSTKGDMALWGVLSLPKRREKVPVVIAVHGFGGTKSKRKFVELGRIFAQNGIAVLRFDFSGCGDSEGHFEKLSISQQVSELVDAYNFLKKQPKTDMNRIGFLGHSLGALIVCLLESQYGVIYKTKSLVLVAPALNQKDLAKIWFAPSQIRMWRKQGYLDAPRRIGVQYLNEAKDYSPIASKIRIPVIVIHGTEDKDVPLKFAKNVFKALGGKKELKIIEGADHDFESYLTKEIFINLSLGWFKNYL